MVDGFARLIPYLHKLAADNGGDKNIIYEVNTDDIGEDDSDSSSTIVVPTLESFFIAVWDSVTLCTSVGHPVYAIDCASFRCPLMSKILSMILTGMPVIF